jgi:hypothetical protein
MEHRFTETHDGTSAGAWWTSNATWPELAWMYDADRQVLTVTTKSGATTEHRIVTRRVADADSRRAFLPGLALHIGRRVAQSRK